MQNPGNRCPGICCKLLMQMLPSSANHGAASMANHAYGHHCRPIAVLQACAVATQSYHGKANAL